VNLWCGDNCGQRKILVTTLPCYKNTASSFLQRKNDDLYNSENLKDKNIASMLLNKTRFHILDHVNYKADIKSYYNLINLYNFDFNIIFKTVYALAFKRAKNEL